jgi:hypothetical protein
VGEFVDRYVSWPEESRRRQLAEAECARLRALLKAAQEEIAEMRRRIEMVECRGSEAR